MIPRKACANIQRLALAFRVRTWFSGQKSVTLKLDVGGGMSSTGEDINCCCRLYRLCCLPSQCMQDLLRAPKPDHGHLPDFGNPLPYFSLQLSSASIIVFCTHSSPAENQQNFRVNTLPLHLPLILHGRPCHHRRSNLDDLIQRWLVLDVHVKAACIFILGVPGVGRSAK